MSNRRPVRLLGLAGRLGLAASLLLVLPRSASASQSFPDTLKDEWQLPLAPPCTLCHQTSLGGFGTATKAFARALIRNGATAADTNALRRALRSLQTANSDVDHDGASDFDELQTGTDPDQPDVLQADGGVASAAVDDGPIPRTGCSIVTVGRRPRLTAPLPSPTVGPTSGATAPSRRISGDAWLVCSLILCAVTSRLRAQRKRMAGAAR
jgi:hypothetical protein